jgi:hypothetical protein
MLSTRASLVAWSLGGLCLVGALAIVLTGASFDAKGEERDNDALSEDETESLGPPLFKNVTAASGVAWTCRNGEEFDHCAILEQVGGGVGLIDFDGDGLLDLFVVGGGFFDKYDKDLAPRPKVDSLESAKKLATLPKVDRRCKILGHPCKLYRNLGNGKFEDVTDRALQLDGPWFYSHGCAVADYDCDGWPDLLLTGWDRVALFHNEPDPKDPTRRRLVDVTRKVGLDKVKSWCTSAGFADLDGDGYPELYLCCYVDWSWGNHPLCVYAGGKPDVCGPELFSGLRHKLFRNNAGRSFSDVSESVEVDKGPHKSSKGLCEGGPDSSKGLGVVLVDLNQDGKPDIYVANDMTENFLYFNRSAPGKFRFAERAVESGTAGNDQGEPEGSMGVDAGDYNRSGRPHLFVTNFEYQRHALYHNDGKCVAAGHSCFSHRSTAARLGALGRTFVSWGTGFVDVENRGWEDLFFVSGHTLRFPERLQRNARRQRPVLLRNLGNGTFRDMSKRGGDYFDGLHLARGLALGDLDNDGRVDAVISHVNDPVVILKNVAAADNHWLGVELVGEKFRDVVGTRLSLEVGGHKQWRFAKGGGSYLSARDPRHVFGLGQETTVGRLSVTWPDGKEQHWDHLAPDRYYRLTQGKDQAQEQPSGRRFAATLSSLRSRWTMPRSWACCIARARRAMSRAASVGGSASRPRRFAGLPPSTSSG